MTEGQVQGKWVLVRNNGEFEITEFELAGPNCIRGKGIHRDLNGVVAFMVKGQSFGSLRP